jgi:voltage-gated potassium channel
LPFSKLCFNLSGDSLFFSAKLNTMWTVDENNHFIYLTIGLIGLLITSALVQSVPDTWDYALVQGAPIAWFLLAMQSLKTLSRQFRWGYFLIGLMIISFILRHFIQHILIDVVFIALLLVFYQSAFWAVSRQVLFKGKSDLNTIIGSLAMYLLLGLTWSIVYLVLLFFIPDAISGIPQQEWGENMTHTNYFSFVTLTTLGYGDLIPVSTLARVFAYLEAVTGLFFIAIVVASLINSIDHE